jgi:glycosyltransferase involved in cell wall biosynthesis
MIKILQIGSSSGLGGGEVVMFNIIRGLKNEFQFFIAAPQGEFLTKYKEINLQIYPIWQQGLLKNVVKLRKIILKEKPEIIHFHGTRAAFWGRLAVIGLKNKPRVIYTLHGLHIIRKPFYLKLPLVLIERLLNRWTDILVCVSEADKNLVLKYKIISLKKIRLIKNGIDLGKFQVEQQEIQRTRKELGLENKFILSSIGRLHPQKDFSTILKALKIIVSQIQNTKLLIIGDGPLRQELEEETKQLGVNEYVKFLGWREDVPVLTNLSDVMILSSNWEAFGLVCLEAGACKKPIVASDIEGVNEAVKDGETGLLFKKGDEEDLAQKIMKLYNSEELRKEMGENAYNFVKEDYSKNRMVEEYKTLYKNSFRS